MPARVRTRLTFANVCSFLALMIAIGTGGAYAADTIGSSDIINESILSEDLKNGEVKTNDIVGGAVTSPKIHADAVTTSDLAADAVDGSKVLDASIARADLASNAVTGAKVLDNSITMSDIGGGGTTGLLSVSGVDNGRCSQITVSVSGATVGDVVIMATNGQLQNGVFVHPMRVEANGAVETSVCNFSGTSMTPITNLPIRIYTID
jgi:hypothetical protein